MANTTPSTPLGAASASYTVRVRLPPPLQKSIFLLVPNSATVDHVKNEVFRSSSHMEGEVAEDFALGVSEEEVLYVEFVKLAMCHKSIREAVTEDRTVHLFLLPKSRIVKFQHARMASPYRLPRMAKASETSEEESGGQEMGRDHSLMCVVPSKRPGGYRGAVVTSKGTTDGLGVHLPDLSTPAPAPPPHSGTGRDARDEEEAKSKREREKKSERPGGERERGRKKGESERGGENGKEERENERETEREKGEEMRGREERVSGENESEGERDLEGKGERESDGRGGGFSPRAVEKSESDATDPELSDSDISSSSPPPNSYSHLYSESDSESVASDGENSESNEKKGESQRRATDALDGVWEGGSGDERDPKGEPREESVEQILAFASTSARDPADKFAVSFTALHRDDDAYVPVRITAEGTGSFYSLVPPSSTVKSARLFLVNQLQRALDVLNDESHVVDVEAKAELAATAAVAAAGEGRARHLRVVTRPTMDSRARPAPAPPTPASNDSRRADEQAATQIGNLLGNALYQATNGPQAISFRSKMAKLFSSRYQGDKPQDVIRARITNSRLPETIGDKILCKFFVAKKSTSNTVLAHVKDSFLDVVSKVVMSHARRQILSRSAYESDDFFVKIQGSSEYVLDDVAVGSLVRVRELVKNNMPVCFVLISKEEQRIKDQIDSFLRSEQEQMAACKLLDMHLDGVEKMVSNFTAVSEVRRRFELRIVALESMSEMWEGEGEETEGTNLSPRSPRTQFAGSLRGNRSAGALNSSSPSVGGNGGGGGGGGERYLYVECSLYHGVEKMSATVRTKAQQKQRAVFVESVAFDILISDIPKATRAAFVVFEASSPTAEGEEVAWVNVQLVDYSNELRSGVLYLGLWCHSPSSPIGTCEPNSKSPLALTIELPRNQIPILFVPDPAASAEEGRRTPAPLRRQQAPSEADQERIEELLKQDALHQATEEEKQLMWRHRDYYRNVPRSTVKLLLSVPWNCAKAVEEAHEMLREWAPLNPYEGLELLDAKFADAHVRRFGVNCLAQLNHEELAAIMLQLVQVLKYEPYHDSALARFLLQRALSNRQMVGHAFFWHLHAELHVEQISERYVLLAEVYLRCSGAHRIELVKQLAATRRIHELALLMQKTPAAKRTHVLRTNLRCLGMPTKFKLPSNPRMEVEEIVIDKCKTKDSFTAPLWLVFKVRDMVPSPSYVPVIFKAGDDLRQDALTLQMFRLMDEVWKREGLDLHMSIYGVLASADSAGYIEVVQNAASLADIQKNAGGIVTLAFAKTTLQRWLRQHNQSDAQYELAAKKFIFSCAGYSVATYLLGLGDRHNDNIMVTTSGHLFHIDFAHFLGNIMKWKGIKRETAPFVLTPAIAHVMGGVKSEQFQHFRELCCKAFNILRKHSHVFITLFALMVSTGIPQLNSYADIHFLRNAFMLHLTDAEAETAFLKLIDKCLSSLFTKVNFVVHLMAHPNKDT